MRHIFLALTLVFSTVSLYAQEAPKLLKSTGWGSLSGKVIDEKTKKPVAEAMVFLKATSEIYFPIHADDKVRKDFVIQIPSGREFDRRLFAHYREYFDGAKKISTGQKFVLVGDRQQEHAIDFHIAAYFLATDGRTHDRLRMRFRAGDPETSAEKGTALIGAGKRETSDLTILTAYHMQSRQYSEMRAMVFVFDHPYFGITDKDGVFTIPRVPAGAEVTVIGWQHDIGWLLTNKGKQMTFKEGKNEFNIAVKAP